MTAHILDPLALAKKYRQDLKQEVTNLGAPIKLVGFLPQSTGPSMTYAQYTETGCHDVGFSFELRRPSRLQIETEIEKANLDPGVHGIIIYYPVFNSAQDSYVKDLVIPEKDIEGLSSFWIKRLYRNERELGQYPGDKAILPCTPLAILKLLESAGAYLNINHPKPLKGMTATVFNRSEVVGRPLASMLHHDGARVFSFDAHGPIELGPDGFAETSISRSEALRVSDLVVTGVPHRDFALIEASQIKQNSICLNFSTYRNFADDITEKAAAFIPRVGPMTVTMALRNTLRLYLTYHRLGRLIGGLH
jgi:methylenetetrahydrofolate dehydrogenase (NADP+)/methenyltetrahydrofolate cyclohydrolase